MRIITATALAALTALGAVQAHAASKNPFEIRPGKYNKGMIIIAIEDEAVVMPGGNAIDPPYDLRVVWFDAAHKKPHLELLQFKMVNDEQGHRYLIEPVGEGDTMIVAFTIQNAWSMCYNAQTYHFYVKANTYNFIGRFDQLPSRRVIEQAVLTGKMPRYVSQYGYIVPLVDRKLEGFTVGQDLPEDKQRIEALAAQNLGHPVEIITPPLMTTEYNLSKDLAGQTSCEFWRSKADRPDRSTPDSGPQKDEVASTTEPVQ